MTDTDRKDWEQQQRSNRIVDKAQAVFFENGYENTTLPAIADAAGYNKRTLYLYFKDKEEIFLAVVLRGLIQLRATLEKAIDPAGSTDSGLQHMARAFFDFSVHSPEFLDLIPAGALVGAGMHQPFMMGEHAVEQLVRHLEGRPVPRQVLMPVLAVSGDNLADNLARIRRNVLGLDTE